MRHISNAYGDRYRAAIADERACEKAAAAIAKAVSKTLEAASVDISPELARELMATHDQLTTLFGRVATLREQASNRAQAIASAAVSEAHEADFDFDEPTLYDLEAQQSAEAAE